MNYVIHEYVINSCGDPYILFFLACVRMQYIYIM